MVRWPKHLPSTGWSPLSVDKDPIFLTETLGSLLESGAIEKRDTDGRLAFSNCRLTSAGEAFLSSQRSSSLAERHGMEFCFDVVTGEHIVRLPKGCRSEPSNPIIPTEQLPERRTNIGLDTARKLAKTQDEPFLTAQSKLTDVSVQQEQGEIVWRSYEVRLVIDPRGIISCKTIGSHDTLRRRQGRRWVRVLVPLNHLLPTI